MDPNDFGQIPPINFYGKRFKTLESAADNIEESSHNDIDVIIIPTDVDYQTDNEDIDEDNLLPAVLPKDIPGQIEVSMQVMMNPKVTKGIIFLWRK